MGMGCFRKCVPRKDLWLYTSETCVFKLENRGSSAAAINVRPGDSEPRGDLGLVRRHKTRPASFNHNYGPSGVNHPCQQAPCHPRCKRIHYTFVYHFATLVIKWG